MKKKGKKYWSKGFYILISVIVVPTLLTILLTAFEDTTNEWMMRIGGNEPAAIKAKRLAGSGELIHSDCARLGMKLEDVLKKCPQPVYRLTEHQTEKPYHFIEKLRSKGRRIGFSPILSPTASLQKWRSPIRHLNRSLSPR